MPAIINYEKFNTQNNIQYRQLFKLKIRNWQLFILKIVVVIIMVIIFGSDISINCKTEKKISTT